MNKKYIKLSVVFIVLFIIGVVGVTYAFFNYTRTGTLNNLGTGRIYFSSNMGDTFSLTNAFPMSSQEASTANLDAITIGIEGYTNYSNGEEYVISIVDYSNMINNKNVPMNYIATYSATSGNTIGTSSNDYWNERNNKDAHIYTLASEGVIREDKQILVGYIKNSENGISGVLNIKPYIDRDRIAITDTYPEGRYQLNPNMTEEELAYCTSFMADEYSRGENNSELYCLGIGTIDGYSFYDDIPFYVEESEYLETFLAHNIMIDIGAENGTTIEWTDDRTLFTTEEWNSLGTNPISFKIRAESNNGIWVEPDTKTNTCPNCKFIFPTEIIYTKWNTVNKPPTVITGATDNFEEIVEQTGRNYFIGVVLDENNLITNEYLCGIKNDSPICVEGTSDGSKYEYNNSLLQSSKYWNNMCRTTVEETSNGQGYIYDYCSVLEPRLTIISDDTGYIISGSFYLRHLCNFYPTGGSFCAL